MKGVEAYVEVQVYTVQRNSLIFFAVLFSGLPDKPQPRWHLPNQIKVIHVSGLKAIEAAFEAPVLKGMSYWLMNQSMQQFSFYSLTFI